MGMFMTFSYLIEAYNTYLSYVPAVINAFIGDFSFFETVYILLTR